MSPSRSASPVARLPRRLVYERGATLIEIMVGLLIGLIITGAASAVFLAANKLGRGHDESAKLMEDGGFVVSRIVSAIKKSGYVDLLSDTNRFEQLFEADSPVAKVLYAPQLGKLDKFGAVYQASTGYDTGLFGCSNGTLTAAGACTPGGAYDALRVAFQAVADTNTNDPFSASVSVKGVAGSIFADCTGQPPPPGVEAVINHYYVNASRQLICRGNGTGQEQVILPNVMQFQLRYGLSNAAAVPPDVSRRVVWLTADQVTAADRWNAVVQTELCLIVNAGAGTAPAQSVYVNCNGVQVSHSDTRQKKTFRTVVTLRNAPV